MGIKGSEAKTPESELGGGHFKKNLLFLCHDKNENLRPLRLIAPVGYSAGILILQ